MSAAVRSRPVCNTCPMIGLFSSCQADSSYWNQSKLLILRGFRSSQVIRIPEFMARDRRDRSRFRWPLSEAEPLGAPPALWPAWFGHGGAFLEALLLRRDAPEVALPLALGVDDFIRQGAYGDVGALLGGEDFLDLLVVFGGDAFEVRGGSFEGLDAVQGDGGYVGEFVELLLRGHGGTFPDSTSLAHGCRLVRHLIDSKTALRRFGEKSRCAAA